MSKKVALILSGCGFLDGAEIREAVLSLLYLDKHSAEVSIFAPDKQLNEVDHLTGKETGSSRNVLMEAARIARGKIKNIKELKTSSFDALVLPGGFGVAKNLSSFATQGTNATLDEDFKRIVLEFVDAHKPIAAICISPAVLSKVLENRGGAKLTSGTDTTTAEAIEALGSVNVPTQPDEIVEDTEKKIVSTPAYMHDSAPIAAISKGIEKCISKVLEWA